MKVVRSPETSVNMGSHPRKYYVLLRFYVSSGWMFGEEWIGKYVEGKSRYLIEVLSWQLHDATEENHENLLE
jgi:hypothetical protein